MSEHEINFGTSSMICFVNILFICIHLEFHWFANDGHNERSEHVIIPFYRVSTLIRDTLQLQEESHCFPALHYPTAPADFQILDAGCGTGTVEGMSLGAAGHFVPGIDE